MVKIGKEKTNSRKLAHVFWGEVVTTLCYVINMSPTRRVNMVILALEDL